MNFQRSSTVVNNDTSELLYVSLATVIKRIRLHCRSETIEPWTENILSGDIRNISTIHSFDSSSGNSINRTEHILITYAVYDRKQSVCSRIQDIDDIIVSSIICCLKKEQIVFP